MKKLTSDEMTSYLGGGNRACSQAGTAGDWMSIVGLGLGMVALVATGPVGLLAGAFASSVAIAGGGLGIGYLIGC